MRQLQLLAVAWTLGLLLSCGGGTDNEEPADQTGQELDSQDKDVSGQDIPVPDDTSKPDDQIEDETHPGDAADAEPLEDVKEDLEGDEKDVPCTPDCTGKLCGPDGCDGNCGTCELGAMCDPGTFTCIEAPAGVATLFDSMHIPYGGGTDCCFDFNGDEAVDNAVGGLLDTLSSLLGETDPNQLLADAIQSGQVAVLLEFVEVTDWTNAQGITMNAYLGSDADSDYTDNLDPTNGGEFMILSSSLDDLGNPLIVFQQTSIEGGVLRAGPSKFVLDIPLVGSVPITLVLDQARIEGDLTVESQSKIHIANGKLGGVVQKKVIIEGLNAYVASSCQCLGISGDLIDAEAESCAADGTPELCVEEEACGSIYNYCGMAISLFDSILDVDQDDDGAYDSISIGIQFTSIPATIVGKLQSL